MKILRTMLATTLLACSLSANAIPVTFDVAGAPSSYVSVDAVCFPFCGVTAQLNPLLDSYSHSLSAGESWTFDLFTLNIFGLGGGLGTINAFLAFDSPIGAPGAEGDGFGAFLTGEIDAGFLVWSQPGSFLLADGTSYGVRFDNLLGTSRDQDIVVRATVSLTQEPTGVPEPSTLALLGMGLLGWGVAGRRRKERRGSVT